MSTGISSKAVTGFGVIMAGGSGTRFWPLSKRDRPKQFLNLFGERTLLQDTWHRAVQIFGDPSRVLVVTSRAYEVVTREQLPSIPSANLLLEPQARNTAPCLAWAAAVVAKREPRAIMVAFPADHVIRDVDGLASAIAVGATAAQERGALVTFGIPPRYPETGYGYVEVGERLELGVEVGVWPDVHQVESFREKPDLEMAQHYVQAGTFLWNSGMFVWRVDEFGEQLRHHLPDAAMAAVQMVEATDEQMREEAYGNMPATSIDYGVMERAANVACVRAPFDWSDVGSWAALHELLGRDQSGNVSWGPLVIEDARENLIFAPELTVALLGVDGLAIVRAGDILLVASLDRSQEVKALREQLEKFGLDHHL